MSDKLLDTMAVRIPPDMHDDLNKVCAANRTNASEVVRALLRTYLADEFRRYEALHQVFGVSNESARNDALQPDGLSK